MPTPPLPPDGGKPDPLVDAVDQALSRNRPDVVDPGAGAGLDPVLRDPGALPNAAGGATPRRRSRSLVWAALVTLLGLAAGAFVYLTRDAYTVEVRSMPAGADVEVDGQPMGRSPAILTFRRAPARVRLRLDGYDTAELPLLFDADGLARLDVALARLVRIESDPPGARILLDEIDTGLFTPATVSIKEPRPIEVGLRLDGFHAASLPVTDELIREGRGQTVLEKTPEADGRVIVSVSGSYPFSVAGCGAESAEAESHTMTVRPPCSLRVLSPAFLLDAERAIEPTSERRVEITVPPIVSVQLRSRHENCALVVNGRTLGNPPVDVMIAEGRYSATFRCPDGRTLQTRAFEIAAGQSVRRVDDFLP